MSLVERVVQRVRRDYFRWQYQKVARQILDTRPVKRGDLPFTLLSMVHQRDVLVERLHLALDDLVDHVLGLPFRLDLLDEDAARAKRLLEE